MTELESIKLRADIEKTLEEIVKTRSEIVKINREVRHVTVMTFVAPFATAAGLIAATATLVKIFFS